MCIWIISLEQSNLKHFSNWLIERSWNSFSHVEMECVSVMVTMSSRGYITESWCVTCNIPILTVWYLEFPWLLPHLSLWVNVTFFHHDALMWQMLWQVYQHSDQIQDVQIYFFVVPMFPRSTLSTILINSLMSMEISWYPWWYWFKSVKQSWSIWRFGISRHNLITYFQKKSYSTNLN